jgi:hypothetical protein
MTSDERCGNFGVPFAYPPFFISISKKYNFEFCIPPSQFENVWNDHQLFKVFKLSSLRNIGYVPDTFPTIQERFYHFDDELFENCKDGCNLNGYFQTQKYFEHISVTLS